MSLGINKCLDIEKWYIWIQENCTYGLLVASVLLKLRTNPHFRWYLKEMGAERTLKIA